MGGKNAPGRRTRMDKGWEGLRSAVHLENKAARVAAGESGRERESRLLATRPDSIYETNFIFSFGKSIVTL